MSWMTTGEFATFQGVSEADIWRWIDQGMPFVARSDWFASIPVEEANAWLAERGRLNRSSAS